MPLASARQHSENQKENQAGIRRKCAVRSVRRGEGDWRECVLYEPAQRGKQYSVEWAKRLPQARRR